MSVTLSGEVATPNAVRNAATSLLFTLLREAIATVSPVPVTPAVLRLVRSTSCAASLGVSAAAPEGEVSAARSELEVVRDSGVVSADAASEPSSETNPAMTGASAEGSEILFSITARLVPETETS